MWCPRSSGLWTKTLRLGAVPLIFWLCSTLGVLAKSDQSDIPPGTEGACDYFSPLLEL